MSDMDLRQATVLVVGAGIMGQGIAQIGEAVQQLDQTTQQNAALVEEAAAAAGSLRSQARQAKLWPIADAVRNGLASLDYEVKDLPDGTCAVRKK